LKWLRLKENRDESALLIVAHVIGWKLQRALEVDWEMFLPVLLLGKYYYDSNRIGKKI
jgi:hypothetical protein